MISLSDKRNGYPTHFLNDGSKRNPHGNKMIEDFKTPVENGTGTYGFVQGYGAANFRDLFEFNPHLLTDEIE